MNPNIPDQKNWLERLADRIPGYNGYLDRDRRRDIDKMHREHMANRLRSLKQPLTDLARDLTSGRLMEVGTIDRVTKKLDQIENRIRYASYGYSGFFDTVKIQETQLDQIYRFDLDLVEKVDALERQVRAIKSRSAESEGLRAATGEIETALDEMNRKFDERYNAINNFGQGQQPVPPTSFYSDSGGGGTGGL